MKNKAQGLSLNTVIISAIVLIVLIILGVILYNKFDIKFNPDKDICLDYERWCSDLNNDGIFNCSEESYNGDCLTWRSKTKCEIDPNAEGCICDEYEYQINDSCKFDDHSGIVIKIMGKLACDFKFAKDKGGMGIYLDNTCIKAHKANECELGNGDYTQTCTHYKLHSNDENIYNGTSHLYTREAYLNHKDDSWISKVECVEYEECRKKSMQDLSCKSLIKIANYGALLDNDYFNSLTFGDYGKDIDGRIGYMKDALKIAEEKGCEI